MQNKQTQSSFVQHTLPWLAVAGGLLFYLLTLNHWVTVRSLPVVAKVTGWDWTLPAEWPLYVVLTLPFKIFPATIQPLALNLFSAVCSALTLGLLARSVALLPHDRTVEQRLRERSEFSLLSVKGAWMPASLAVLVCGLELTMWENATAATTEALNLLVFAYCVRCLLEFRVSQKETWLLRLAFVYGLGITNNWGMIGFVPAFLVSLVWIKGRSFFQLRFLGRMLGLFAAGLLLYLALPALWSVKGAGDFSFWEVLRFNISNQTTWALHTPYLRIRVLLLSLTSLLPLAIIGVRWPSSFGDTSAAGAVLTNFMFRLVHTMFAVVCISVAFNQKWSPRALGVPFLTFYYMGALCVGYYIGYVVLVFRDVAKKTWQRQAGMLKMLSTVMQGLAWAAFVAVPIGLVWKNLPVIQANNGPFLREFAKDTLDNLPSKQSYLLSDDAFQLLVLEAFLQGKGGNENHVLVHTRSLEVPSYHQKLLKHYGSQWPNLGKLGDLGQQISAPAIHNMLAGLAASNAVYYLHPSFGGLFERVYAEAHGPVYLLKPYPTNGVFAPALSAKSIQENAAFWTGAEALVSKMERSVRYDPMDVRYVAAYYSRAMNYWGVQLQRAEKTKEAGPFFERAVALNTNNVSAILNLEFNQAMLKNAPAPTYDEQTLETKMGKYQTWNPLLAENGPFDVPAFCQKVGEAFVQESFIRQAIAEFTSAARWQPTNFQAKLTLGNTLLFANQADQVFAMIADIRNSKTNPPLSVTNLIELSTLESAAWYSQKNFEKSEKVLLDTAAKYPAEFAPLESLLELYRAAGRPQQALKTLDKQLAMAPGSLPHRLVKAEIHVSIGELDNANAEVDKALAIAPKSVPALIYRVFVAMQRKDYKTALAQLEPVFALEPDNTQALTYQGVSHMELQEYDKALTAFEKVLKLEPNSVAALRNRAVINLKSNKLDAAEKDYQVLLQALPRAHFVHYGLGEIAYRNKKYADAAKSYELYLKYAPEEDSPEMAQEKKMIKQRLAEIASGKR